MISKILEFSFDSKEPCILYNTVGFVLFPVCATIIFRYFVVVVRVYVMCLSFQFENA